LHRLDGLAADLGLASVWVKDESSRLGLPAFKMLGASWATYRSLVERLGHEPEWSTIDELTRALDPLRPLRLCSATDGNHGRAVARTSRSWRMGRTSVLDMTWVVTTPTGTDTFAERHELGLFTTDETRASVEGAGLVDVVEVAGAVAGTRSRWVASQPG
jgi:hypothetical protein